MVRRERFKSGSMVEIVRDAKIAPPQCQFGLATVSAVVQETQVAEGPFMLEFSRKAGLIAMPRSGAWECQAAYYLRSVKSYVALLVTLAVADANTRIIACDLISSCGGNLLSHAGKALMILGLRGLLADATPNQYQYGGFQSEDESMSTVSQAAATALFCLGYPAISEEAGG